MRMCDSIFITAFYLISISLICQVISAIGNISSGSRPRLGDRILCVKDFTRGASLANFSSLWCLHPEFNDSD